MERRGLIFPDDDLFVFGDDSELLFTFPTLPPQFQNTNPPRITRRPNLTKPPNRLSTPHSPSAPPPTAATSRLPKFPFSDEERSELSTGVNQPVLSPTALVFIGLSAFILFGVIIAGVYFWFKSRRLLKHGGSGSHSFGKAPVEPKGRGVTRPSFLPSHDQKINPNGGETGNGKSVRPHAVPESIHLEIPSPEEWNKTNYPIKTPYSFPSTSTVVTEPEETTQAINAESQPQLTITGTLVNSKPVAMQPAKAVNPFVLQPVPSKPARTKAKECNGVNVVDPELGMGDELPTHRITVY